MCPAARPAARPARVSASQGDFTDLVADSFVAGLSVGTFKSGQQVVHSIRGKGVVLADTGDGKLHVMNHNGQVDVYDDKMLSGGKLRLLTLKHIPALHAVVMHLGSHVTARLREKVLQLPPPPPPFLTSGSRTRRMLPGWAGQSLAGP